MFCIVWRGFRRLLRIIRYAITLFVLFFVLQRSSYPLYLNWNAVSAIVRDVQFDYITWEINALAAKTSQVLWGIQPFMDEARRSQFVRDYMADLAVVQQIEAEIQAIYADPTVADPDHTTAEKRAERDRHRANLRKRQSLAESILEGQVAAVLVDAGFGTLGQLLPPIAMRFTQMPYLLVVSPRDRIERSIELALDPLPLEDVIRIESRIEQERNLSPLVVPLGGMALYPAMIQESSSIPWTVETFAHEWVHHYFFFFPLGQNYFSGNGVGEALTINETTADVFGKEVAQLVLARYYPELIRASTETGIWQTVSIAAQTVQPFDFGRTMHVTRVTVDKNMAVIQVIEAKVSWLREHGDGARANYLAERSKARIAAVEQYMEQRRMIFIENGYHIRKLNQAYFAFYGGYQAGDRPGVGGRDPIGPAVREIRDLSPNLHEFIVTMRGITTREELLRVRDRLEQNSVDVGDL